MAAATVGAGELVVPPATSPGRKIDHFEGGWTKTRSFLGVRTLTEALLNIHKRVHSVYTKIRSERVTFFTGWRSEFHRR
jgi:hypothetical protein